MQPIPHYALVAALVMILGLVSIQGVAQDVRGSALDPPTRTEALQIKGQYWALLIGIENYKDASIPHLKTPVNDVTELAKVLIDRYGFADERVNVLINENATRESIEGTLYRLAKDVGPDDSLLIYYAGHGQMEAGSRGFWIPTDGKIHSPGTWINNAVIRNIISEMSAKHVYLVADSCFSGTLFAASRSLSPEADEKYFQRLYETKSRWGLTSGMNEPVADDGKDGHSIFAYFFLKALKENEKDYLTPSQISVSLPPLVSRNAVQQPRSQPLQGAGDEGGQFLFVRKTNWISEAKSVLRDNALPEAARAQWYHSPIGSLLVPYDWFLVLLNEDQFRNNLYRTGFWSDPNHPDRLPVGLSKTEHQDTPIPFVGVTCAACHTTQFMYKGTAHRIEGGSSLHFNFRFLTLVVESFRKVLTTDKFPQFATEVLSRKGTPTTTENIRSLAKEINNAISAWSRRVYKDRSPEAWGPGRYDLFGRAMNTISVPMDIDNYRSPDVPVSIPPLWGTYEYDRLTWSGLVKDHLVRDVLHASAVAEGKRFNDILSLRELAQLTQQISPPRWSSLFPPINRELATKGKDLYHGNKAKGIPNLCAHCHVPSVFPKAQPNDWSLNVTLIPQAEVGTDTLYLERFKTRKRDINRIGSNKVRTEEMTRFFSSEVMTAYKLNEDPEYQGFTGTWQDFTTTYIARPHVAVWATAPFLHNGSVPNLYGLLSPASERPDCFYLSPNMEFDPLNVGYAVTKCNSSSTSPDPMGEFEFKTYLPGNSNQGHEFAGSDCSGSQIKPGRLGCELPVADRWAIIEYLKTCDMDRLVLRDSPDCRDLE